MAKKGDSRKKAARMQELLKQIAMAREAASPPAPAAPPSAAPSLAAAPPAGNGGGQPAFPQGPQAFPDDSTAQM